MGIEDTHEMILFMLDKTQQEYVSHERIDDALHMAQMQRFMELYGNLKQYQPGRPIANVAYGMTQKVDDELKKFKTTETYTTATDALVNFSSLSASYAHLLSLRIVYTENSVERQSGVKVLSEDQIAQRINSQIVAPTDNEPVALIGNTSIQLFPDNKAHSVIVSYLRLPTKPKYAYSVGSDGRTVTFDSANSVDLEFPDTSYNDIVMKALNILSVNTKDSFLNQYSEVKTQQGV